MEETVKKISKQDMYFAGALILAIWFAITSGIWTYYANLVISFPFGILSLVLLYKGKRIDPWKSRYRSIVFILGLGVLISLIILVCLLIYN